MITKPKALGYDLFIILIILISGWKFTYGLETILDISLYDESGYLYQGVKLLNNGFPNAEHAPMYAIWYYILSLWEPDRIELYYLNYQLLAILLPILLYLVLRRYKLSILSSTIISLFFLICHANLVVWPKVSHFALLIVLAFFIMASFTKYITSRLAVVCVGALLCSYVRPEFFITFMLLFFIYFGFIVFKLKACSFPQFTIFLGVVLISGLLIKLFGVPLGGDRSIVAFGQHFALNWVQWTGSELSPWTNWEEIINQNYGDIHNVKEAFLSNPLLFLKHATYNFLISFKQLIGIFFYHNNIVLPNSFEVIEALLLLGLFFLYVYLSRNKWFPQLKNTIKANKWLLLIFSCYLMTSFMSVVIIYPRNHYLLLAGTLIVIVLAIFTVGKESKQRFIDYKRLVLLGFLFVSLTPQLSVHFLRTTANKSTLKTIMFIKSLNIAEEVNILEAEGGYHIYLSDNFHRVAEYDKSVSFKAFRSDRKINMIVLTKHLNNDTRFKNDKEWQYFVNNCVSLGYTKIDIPNTERQLIVDKQLLVRVN